MLVLPTCAALWLASLLPQAAPLPELPSTAPAVRRPDQQRVDVVIAGADAQVQRLFVAIAEALRRLGVEPRLEQPTKALWTPVDSGNVFKAPDPTGPIVTARLFLDLRQRQSVVLYVVDDQHQRVFVRRFRAALGVDELAIEQLALSASSSVDAILAGQLIGVARRDYEESLLSRADEPSERPTQVDAEPQRTLGSLSAAYGISWLGPGALTHGPALGLKLERVPWGMGLGVHGRLPIVVGPSAADSVQVRLTTLGFRYRLSYQVLARASESVHFGLGFGGDFTQVAPRQEPATHVAALSPYWAADGLAQGYVGFAHRAASYRLGVMLGVDYALAGVRYLVEAAPTSQLVFEPSRARPLLEIELAVP